MTMEALRYEGDPALYRGETKTLHKGGMQKKRKENKMIVRYCYITTHVIKRTETKHNSRQAAAYKFLRNKQNQNIFNRVTH